ncbi:hypothetical protein NE686_04035 [Tissierella carlieri]|uniref:Resolvase/invertase-type recombinase catalytic domain-containing protein n=1 Tax=Tissierella carlieri TaxID=689904 RepID=A0ABT1S6Z9_9FIRM|nr:hypothetical protein [Tissierella carlieri]MCQ4922241.1 hypothetical protein [Tissierella carlieri]
MKKNNYENKDRGKRTLKAAIYIRVGSIEQLSLEAEQGHFNLKVESLQKGEESDATSSCNKEKGINYVGHIGL